MPIAQTSLVHQRTLSLHKSAGGLMPGGLASTYAPWYGDPTLWSKPSLPVFSKGRGALLTDVDGNDYIDYVGAHGAALLGHAEDRVVAALSKAAAKGVAFGAACELEPRLVELMVGRYPGVDQVRLMDTPVEALQTAISLARHFTSRPRILVSEAYTVNGLSALCECGIPDAGAPKCLCAPFNDVSAYERMIAEHAQELAAVLIEPVNVGAGLIAPADRFLPSLRAFCDRHQILLIFDETATGFRLAPGGAAARFNVRPDLTVHGPLIGGAMPLSACAGRKDVLQLAAGDDLAVNWPPVSNNLLAMAAGLTALQALADPGIYRNLDAFASHLRGGLSAAAKAAGIPMQVNRATGMLGVYFSATPITHAVAARSADLGRYADFHAAMLQRGVFLPASPLAPWFISTAHTADHIDRTIEAAHDAFGVPSEIE